MIVSFSDKETEKIWNQQYSKKFPMEIQRIGLRKLIIIGRAKNLNDLKIPPGNKLEQLSGKRQGQYSIRINDQFRICFYWKNGAASSVEITDYH
ncbi:MAG: type II toxin-antitoxin system RelE/ParE family toxin [Actinobacteria bacterium]|nr:type II toxin-antitoxin system RelE/ParE family toxin [Actinomycetota bacterium]MBM3713055.1 type II toxin-antitoxin system RelE/ParE family toxin [Actinomycetota bacterium]